MRMLTVNRGEESLRRLGLRVAAKSFDGLLVIEPEGALGAIAEVDGAGLPVVLMDDRFQRPGFPYVATTNLESGGQAVRHLLDLGRRRPLMVTGPDEYGCTRERLRGFVDVCARAGIEPDQHSIIGGDFLFDSSRGAVAQARADGVEFDAVFGRNDPSADGVLTALHEAGLTIPRDVAVAGFDDVVHLSGTDDRPPADAGDGEVAASLLLDHVRDRPRPPPSRTIPTSLVIRGSTSQPGPN
ncbi:substrate-binding domain-containing protein [Streptomyces sp. NPDC001652]|uniref:LacI family DNA-binding transcriptional regulator n=1 Tax=Streptomyces sp. NPDC001652 TaxID=3154393 RepID=UPI00331B8095